MVAIRKSDRDAVIRRSKGEVNRWSDLIDTLLRAFHRNDEAPPSLGSKMEELRNKRDTMVTKAEALEHHRNSGWRGARQEFDDARQELQSAWRSVIGTLEKESLFV